MYCNPRAKPQLKNIPFKGSTAEQRKVEQFDITMGSYDGAEIFDLVECPFLQLPINLGLYCICNDREAVTAGKDVAGGQWPENNC